MKQFPRFSNLIIFFALGAASFVSASLPKEVLPPNLPQSGRTSCIILTGAQVARFDRCPVNEVMTGIRSFDPLMVYCTRLNASCRNENSEISEGGRMRE